MRKWTLTGLAVCALAVPVAAQSTGKTFVSTVYYHAIGGPDDGLNQMSVMAGIKLWPKDDNAGWRFYAGTEMTDMQPATDNGVEVKRDQGGVGPCLIYVDDIEWLWQRDGGKPVVSFLANLGYLNDAQYDPDAKDDFKWGFIPAAGFMLHLSDDSHAILGVRVHQSWGPFWDTVDLGAGLALTDLDKKLKALAEGVVGIFD